MMLTSLTMLTMTLWMSTHLAHLSVESLTLFPKQLVVLLIRAALLAAGGGVAVLLALLLRDYKNGKIW